MTITGDYLLIALILLALGLTIVSFRVSLLLFRLGAAMAWLALGILVWTDQLGMGLGDPWTQVIAFVFLVMTIAVLTLQFRTDIRHEASVRGKLGTPGAGTESYTTWGPKPKKHKQTAMERQADYKQMLKDRRGRK